MIVLFLLVNLSSRLPTADAFTPRYPQVSTFPTLHLAKNSNSRLEGNQRPPSEEELEIMDTMLDKLKQAAPYELPAAVQRAYRVVSSPPFFLRLAERADQAQSDDEREAWLALANNVVSTVQAVRSTASESMEATTAAVQRIVQAAAEPESGEFLVPLTEERIGAMRVALEKESAKDDGVLLGNAEAVLGMLDAWMNKAHTDGLDGMVVILQKVVQMDAGRRIRESLSSASAKEQAVGPMFDQMLQTDADSWVDVLREAHNDSLDELIVEIQRYLEKTVLAMESGSMNQRVQAEYLKEMLTQTENRRKEMI